MGDGIWKINADTYYDFLRGSGIISDGCNSPGDIYMLKRNGIYMFILAYLCGLYLLEGGNKHQLEKNNINYYYENMEDYYRKVKNAFSPYRLALEKLSEEIKSFGGDGTVHGCIVDISFLSHLYLNPFDGKITLYWAMDTVKKYLYDDIQSLLVEKEPGLINNYLVARDKNEVPLIEKYAGRNKDGVSQESFISVPTVVLDTSMYKPSRVMRSIQYVLDQNIIRIWRDEILTAEFSEKFIETEKPQKMFNLQ